MGIRCNSRFLANLGTLSPLCTQETPSTDDVAATGVQTTLEDIFIADTLNPPKPPTGDLKRDNRDTKKAAGGDESKKVEDKGQKTQKELEDEQIRKKEKENLKNIKKPEESGKNSNTNQVAPNPVQQDVPQNPVQVEVQSQPQQNQGNCMDLGVGRCVGEVFVNIIHAGGNGLFSIVNHPFFPKWG
ncbi:hypothetical protein HMI54_010844 [Coelomomyces lativittatus]|nr:hypothetical protein HMI54_010844 [Coelomomyces lativittatus]KAJ1502114.1 hypothetical protein HMI56_002863 [Coelomomyces lativittatus]KAJ1505335.1 hypothetical protein HMI55_001640 [Coelomomyces lativittatus]